MKTDLIELPVLNDINSNSITCSDLEKEEKRLLNWIQDLVERFKFDNSTDLREFIELGKLLSRQSHMLDTDLELSKDVIRALQKPIIIKRKDEKMGITNDKLLAFRLRHGDFGGWTEEQHRVYLKLRNNMKNQNELEWIKRCSKLLGIRISDINDHVEWEKQLEKLEIIQRERIRIWKLKKLENNKIEEIVITAPIVKDKVLKSTSQREKEKELIRVFKETKANAIVQQRAEDIAKKQEQTITIRKNIRSYKSKPKPSTKERTSIDLQKSIPLPKLTLDFDIKSNQTTSASKSSTSSTKSPMSSKNSILTDSALNSNKSIYDRLLMLQKAESQIEKHASKINLIKEKELEHLQRQQKIKEFSLKITKSYKYDSSNLYKAPKAAIKIRPKDSLNVENISHKMVPNWRK